MNRRIRHIALLALAAVMAVGCGSASEEEVLPSPPQPGQETPIAFSGSLSEKGEVTRTDPADPTGLETVLPEGNKKFKVWAYKNVTSGYQTVMNGYTVNWVENTAYTTTSNTHDWEYVGQGTDQTIKYWDWSASAYRFFGYTGDKADVDVDDDPATITISGIDATDPSSVPYFSRLWYHEPGDDAFGKAVQLVFLQPLARVRFMFFFAEGVTINRSDLNSIQFRRTDDDPDDSDTKAIANKGTVTISYPLSGSATNESWTTATGWYDGNEFAIDYYELPDGKTEDDIDPTRPTIWPNSPEKWYYVLPIKGPGTGGQGSYTLSVGIGASQPKTCVVPAEFMTWAPGYQYTYIFKILDTGDVSLDNIQVAIDAWRSMQVSQTVFNW